MMCAILLAIRQVLVSLIWKVVGIYGVGQL